MKQILFILLLLTCVDSVSQCNNVKTTHRPDGVEVNYFNPQPVIRMPKYEVGTGVYKFIEDGEEIFMLSISVLFKSMPSKSLTGNLTVQTTSQEGISLPLVMYEQIEMNGAKLAVGLYAIDDGSFKILKEYSLKSLFFSLEGNSGLIGSTVTENHSIYKQQLSCLNIDENEVKKRIIKRPPTLLQVR